MTQSVHGTTAKIFFVRWTFCSLALKESFRIPEESRAPLTTGRCLSVTGSLRHANYMLKQQLLPYLAKTSCCFSCLVFFVFFFGFVLLYIRTVTNFTVNQRHFLSFNKVSITFQSLSDKPVQQLHKESLSKYFVHFPLTC